jgi:hypothetical protein
MPTARGDVPAIWPGAISDDDGNHALSFGVWQDVLKHRFHLLDILRQRGRNF